MPGLYQQKDYDLAGFCVGVVEKDKIINGSKAQAGDVLIGLGSSGVHANGFSLVRKILDTNKIDLDADYEQSTLGRTLLEPTRIYVKPILSLLNKLPVHALAHITGGGLLNNIPRVLPSGLGADIEGNSWQAPTIFGWLQKQGNIEPMEMYRTFNCGIGMVIIVSVENADSALQYLLDQSEQASIIGHLHSETEPDQRVRIK